MTGTPWQPDDTILIGQSRVVVADPGQAPRRIPRVYADPVAWLLAEAVGTALESCGEAAPANPRDVGVIGVAAHPTAVTLRSVSEAAGRGAVSPMRFAAAGPGAPVGLICAAFGFQGPTMMLPMPIGDATAAVRTLLADWLTGPARMARHVIVVTHHTTDGDPAARHVATGTVIAGPPQKRKNSPA